jgi:hypothetical protein
MADVNRLGELIDKILSVGDAIILARTSDGGAVAITLMRDREREKAYASDQAELDELVSAMWDQYGGTETSA